MSRLDRCAAAAIAFVVGVFAAAPIRSLSEASKPYNPTRLEWLALDMEARSREELSVPNPDISYFYQQTYSMDFMADENHDAIVVLVRYVPGIAFDGELRKHMDVRIDHARDEICRFAAAFGIPSCPKIIMNVKAMDVPPVQ
jgi:hypothetical protein